MLWHGSRVSCLDFLSVCVSGPTSLLPSCPLNEMAPKEQIASFVCSWLVHRGALDLNKPEDVRLYKHSRKDMCTKVPALENYTLRSKCFATFKSVIIPFFLMTDMTYVYTCFSWLMTVHTSVLYIWWQHLKLHKKNIWNCLLMSPTCLRVNNTICEFRNTFYLYLMNLSLFLSSYKIYFPNKLALFQISFVFLLWLLLLYLFGFFRAALSSRTFSADQMF